MTLKGAEISMDIEGYLERVRWHWKVRGFQRT